MVMGAGLGTRMRPFSELMPKPLLPILGVPCMEFALTRLRQAGITHAVVNSHAHADQIEAYCASNPVEGLRLEVSDERAKLLGSAGGYRHALSKLGPGPFLGVNADVIQLVDIGELVARHQRLRAERKVAVTLALLRGEWLQAQTGRYRKLEVNETTGLINGYSTELLPHTPFWCSIAVFEPEAFESLPDNEPAEFVPAVLEPLIRKKKVGFHWTDTLWMDIGSPELWWKSHFDLYERYRNHALPDTWIERIRGGLSRCLVNVRDQSIDYAALGEAPLGKNSIRLQNRTYAVSNLGNL